MNEVRFLDEGHRHRYHMALSMIFKKIDRPQRFAADFVSTVYLVTGNADLASKAVRYIKNHTYFDWLDLFNEQDFSGGIQVLAQLAVALFTGTGQLAVGPPDLDVADLWKSLDDSNFDLAIRAIQLRRFGPDALAA